MLRRDPSSEKEGNAVHHFACTNLRGPEMMRSSSASAFQWSGALRRVQCRAPTALIGEYWSAAQGKREQREGGQRTEPKDVGLDGEGGEVVVSLTEMRVVGEVHEREAVQIAQRAPLVPVLVVLPHPALHHQPARPQKAGRHVWSAISA